MLVGFFYIGQKCSSVYRRIVKGPSPVPVSVIVVVMVIDVLKI